MNEPSNCKHFAYVYELKLECRCIVLKGCLTFELEYIYMCVL